MKKILALIFILASLQSFGQGVRTKPVYITAFIDGEFKTLQVINMPIAGYTKVNARYEWTAGAMDSGFHVPTYNGVPSGVRSGVWSASGAIAVDTSNHRLYFYSGGSWRYSTASTGGGTPTWQQTLTAGNTASSNLVLDNTTSSSTAVIYKSSNSFLHNFKPSGSVGRNTFLGELAGNFTMTSSGSTSSNITAIGYNAAHGNTTGFDYVSIGVNNLVSITEGGDHTSVGNYALDACTTCTGFSVLGYSAFGSNVSGADGSAVGYDAFRNSTGSRNSGIGVDVFNDLVSGNNNFGGGFNAGDGITGGSGNTILGTATFTSGTYDSLVVLANGFNQKRLYINGNGAWSLDGGSTYGTSGYFLTTTGSGGLPVYSNTLPSGTTIPISSLTAALADNTVAGNNHSFSLTGASNISFGATGTGSPANEIILDGGSGYFEVTAGHSDLRLSSSSNIIIDNNINGSTIANGDLTINGTTNATKTTSYVNIQPLGGNVGIGTSTPSRLLHVAGKSLFTDSIKYSLGANNGYVLTSDANGNATWQPASGGVNSGSALRAAYYPTAGTTVDDVAGVEFANTNERMTVTAQATSEAALTVKQTGGSSYNAIVIKPSDASNPYTPVLRFKNTGGGGDAMIGQDYGVLQIDGSYPPGGSASQSEVRFGSLYNGINNFSVHSYVYGTPASPNNWATRIRTPSTTSIGLVIDRGATYQSADFFQLRKSDNTVLTRFDSSGRLGIGIVPVAPIHTISATEQMRIGFDASNYYTTTVGSTGVVTFDAFGSGSQFKYSDVVWASGGGFKEDTFHIDITSSTYEIEYPGVYDISSTGFDAITFPDPSNYAGKTITIWNHSGVDAPVDGDPQNAAGNVFTSLLAGYSYIFKASVNANGLKWVCVSRYDGTVD